MNKIKIFIGSSRENGQIARWIEDSILEINERDKEIDIETLGWWENSAFPAGKSFYESLLEIVNSCNAAIMIFSEEDLTHKRDCVQLQPRDNIILETGLFAGKHGREQALIARIGKPGLPTDLEGVTCLNLKHTENEEDFKKHNRSKIKNWLFQIKSNLLKSNNIEVQFPNLYKSILGIIAELKTNTIINSHSLDIIASSIFSRISSIFDDESYIAGFLVNRIENELLNCKSIFATDVLGPSAWISPNAYRYLAIQIKYYIRRNTQGDDWHLIVDDDLGKSISKACEKVKKLTGVGQSFSLFDNPKDFEWEIGNPNLQFARILLWSKEELLSPIAESIIAIHQAFNIPVFFIEVDETNSMRENDFIIFEKLDGDTTGFYNSERNQYKPKPTINGGIPHVGNCKDQFEKLMADSNIMLAIDARHILQFK